ncbi:hypothetical protein L204_102502 [Cryptococcus depauperatus]|nr:hypothetical protein L204_00753 [Cryptococcus depauperatus CBS 7855]
MASETETMVQHHSPNDSGPSHTANNQPLIDPDLIDTSSATSQKASSKSASSSVSAKQQPPVTQRSPYHEPYTMGITESIASAPDPKPGDFMPPRLGEEEGGIDLEALESQVDDDIPGSPTAKLMRAIAPQSAVASQPTWPLPPPNASVNLYIGRALLANGNDNWPLKPNDIVNWIRKNYPHEWDGDEGRCSAHRVRTYLARKGADMYYEKLNQGCVAGWRIRQNHLWRFENGGFQGRGMKQEEAIANAQKEHEALATAARKAAAAEALAAGHPNVKVSMSIAGPDGLPLNKRPRIPKPPPIRRPRPMPASTAVQAAAAAAAAAVTRRDGEGLAGFGNLGLEMATEDAYEFDPHQPHNEPQTLYSTLDQATAGSSSAPSSHGRTAAANHLTHGTQSGTTHPSGQTSRSAPPQGPSLSFGNVSETPVDISMVQQAMQAAAGQMDDLEMGMQLPIEMQMHSTEHGDEAEQRGYEYAQGYEGWHNS